METSGGRNEALTEVIYIGILSQGHSYFIIKCLYTKGILHIGSRMIIVLKILLLSSWVTTTTFWVRESCPLTCSHNSHVFLSCLKMSLHFGESKATISIVRHKIVQKDLIREAGEDTRVISQSNAFPPYTKEAWGLRLESKHISR